MRRVACVFAHPDDETFGVGGSLALHAQDEVELTVILATSGEAGRIADASLAMRETRRGIREILHLGLADAYRRQEEIGAPLRRTADAREAQRAFVQKRRPVWTGT